MAIELKLEFSTLAELREFCEKLERTQYVTSATITKSYVAIQEEEKKPEEKKKKALPTPAEVFAALKVELTKFISARGTDEAKELLAGYGVERASDLTEAQKAALLDRLKNGGVA